MALIATRAASIRKTLRFVALEGGGESFTALMAGYVQVVSGDASEAALHAVAGQDPRAGGAVRRAPVRRAGRMCRPRANRASTSPGRSSAACTMGPKVPDADYRKWVAPSTT